VKAADIDGDGDLDILVANIGAQTLGQTLGANNAMFINNNICGKLAQFVGQLHSTHHHDSCCVCLDGEDSNDGCTGWATSGACDTNSEYMFASCCASCKSEFFSVLHWANFDNLGQLVADLVNEGGDPLDLQRVTCRTDALYMY
jgi:hypothetical protein